jgi:ubiquitin-like 1-activating enzyme E1 B
MEDKPIKGLDITKSESTDGALPFPPIPRKRKSAVESNGHVAAGIEDVVHAANGIGGTKRSADEALGHEPVDAKRSKITSGGANGVSTNGEHEEAVVIDDSTDGAIVIDDD